MNDIKIYTKMKKQSMKRLTELNKQKIFNEEFRLLKYIISVIDAYLESTKNFFKTIDVLVEDLSQIEKHLMKKNEPK